jgi:hypothetical protein
VDEPTGMNRRSFFVTLLAAPLAAVAALKAKPLPGGEEVARYPGIEAEWERATWARYPSPEWSYATSSPIADIERAMKQIREHSIPPETYWINGDRLENYDAWRAYL